MTTNFFSSWEEVALGRMIRTMGPDRAMVTTTMGGHAPEATMLAAGAMAPIIKEAAVVPAVEAVAQAKAVAEAPEIYKAVLGIQILDQCDYLND